MGRGRREGGPVALPSLFLPSPLLLGERAEIGQELLENALCRKITFTGSTEVGQRLIRGAAERVKPLSLELGGHGPCLVFEDVDLEKAVEGVMMAKFRNTGAEFRLFAAAKELPRNRAGGESVARWKEQIEKLPRLAQADDGAVRSLAAAGQTRQGPQFSCGPASSNRKRPS